MKFGIFKVVDLGGDSRSVGAIKHGTCGPGSGAQHKACPLHLGMRKYLTRVVRGVVNASHPKSQIGELHPILLGDDFFAAHAAMSVRIDESRYDGFAADIDNFCRARDVDFTANAYRGNSILFNNDDTVR